MNSLSEVGANGDSGLSVLWEDGERVFCRAWREANNGDRTALLAVIPASEQPTPNCLDRLAHECALKDELDSAWAVRPLEIVRDRGRTIDMLALGPRDPAPQQARRGATPAVHRGARAEAAGDAAATEQEQAIADRKRALRLLFQPVLVAWALWSTRRRSQNA